MIFEHTCALENKNKKNTLYFITACKPLPYISSIKRPLKRAGKKSPSPSPGVQKVRSPSIRVKVYKSKKPVKFNFLQIVHI